MDKDTINDINEIIKEKLDKIYNSAKLMSNLSLLNHYKNDIKTWKSKQIKDVPKLIKNVNKMIREEVKGVYKAIEIAVLMAYKVADNTFKDLDVNQKEIQINASQSAKVQIKHMKVVVNQNLNKLPASIRNYQLGNINQVYNEISSKNKVVDDLYEEISRNIDKGLENVPKVTYKNGRQVGYQEYMDMKIRTELQKETRAFQIENARNNNMVFYLCSSLGDCAPDHQLYQGKIYIDENWTSYVDEELAEKVEEYIKANNVQTMQYIEDNPPYLNSRPNCRHHFEPITTEEVLNVSVDKMLRSHDMIKGTYDKQNYIDLQKQRANEREIRRIKTEIAGKEIEWEKAPNGQRNEIEQVIKAKEKEVREYQAKQRELLKNNDILERNYTRESVQYLANDIGKTINVSFKIN